jgi:hypothetical protein
MDVRVIKPEPVDDIVEVSMTRKQAGFLWAFLYQQLRNANGCAEFEEFLGDLKCELGKLVV